MRKAINPLKQNRIRSSKSLIIAVLLMSSVALAGCSASLNKTLSSIGTVFGTNDQTEADNNTHSKTTDVKTNSSNDSKHSKTNKPKPVIAYPDPLDYKDVFDLVADYVVLSAADTKSLKLTADGKKLDISKYVRIVDGHRQFKVRWCSLEKYHSSINRKAGYRKFENVEIDIGNVCESIQRTDKKYSNRSRHAFLRNLHGYDLTAQDKQWCGFYPLHFDGNEPLFAYRVKREAACCDGKGQTTELTIWAPGPGETIDSQSWQKFAESNQFLTSSMAQKLEQDYEYRELVKAESARRANEKKAAEAAKQEYLNKQKRIAQILNTRGLRVCQYPNFPAKYPHFMGYVEDSANGKVKIQISFRNVSDGWSDANFKPVIVWDHPENWYICE